MANNINNNSCTTDEHDHRHQATGSTVDPFICYINYLSNQHQQEISSFSNHNLHHDQHQPSSEDIIRIAGARFLNNYDDDDDDEEDTKKVDLMELLIAASHKVDVQDYDQATTLLHKCNSSSDGGDSSIQRLVSYFSQALLDRISSRSLSRVLPEPTFMISSCLPTVLVSQFCGIQAIVDEVNGAKRVHVIDLFSIRSGAQWTILISALASSDCSIRLVKLTAVGFVSDNNYGRDQDMIEETGNKLVSFAETLNLPFSFRAVMVSELDDFNQDILLILHDDAEEEEDEDEEEDKEEEVTVVYLECVPRKLIRSSPSTEFDKLMKVVKDINPSIMVVSEIEANHNSSVFAYRFMEALFFFGAYFECIEACMDGETTKRTEVEEMYFGESISSIVAFEGEERTVRNVPLRGWRMFFERFGMEEMEIGSSCLDRAKVVIENVVGCEGLCTVEMDEKSLVVGWKGMPLHSVSAWKFMGT
ncbi:DELLA protein GAIP [Linum grandiflorum]